MELTPGTKLGPYEIVSPIGAGGMGEVWKARDTRLDRTVAVKVMPKYIAAREDLRVRFEREARTVSSLNHPNICVLFDIGKQDGTDFMVLEFLEGETLAARIARGRMPPDQALKFATQIADALDRAHRSGVSHRDVKPANVMITRDGCKVLDFGLAKSAPKTIAPDDATLTAALTSEGTILGTLQYMAPEQYEGKEADARSDIFAFGCVLYEMVTGKRAFEGKTKASLIAAVLGADPAPMSAIVPVTPRALERLVMRCLAKDPEDRYQSMRDVVLELRSIGKGGAEAEETRLSKTRLSPRLQAVAAVLALAAGALAFAHFREKPVERPLLRFTDQTGAPFSTSVVGPAVAISPDGSRLAYASQESGKPTHLSVRLLENAEPVVLAGTDGASGPFFSPDALWIGFFTGNTLRKISVQGGAAATICEVDGQPRGGGFWGDDGNIYFASLQTPVMRVSAAGGKPSAVTQLDKRKGDASNRAAQLLPGGEALLFSASRDNTVWEDATVEVQSLRTGQRRTLVQGGYFGHYIHGSDPSSGHLLYVHGDTLFAAPMDLRRLELTGAASPVLQDVTIVGHNGIAHFGFTGSGTIVYIARSATADRSLYWLDAVGNTQALPAAPNNTYSSISISPDGTLIGLHTFDSSGVNAAIYEWAQNRMTKLALGKGLDTDPLVWTPDGKHIAYGIVANGREGQGIYWMRADGGGEPQQIVAGIELYADSFSPDGKRLSYVNLESGIWTVSLDLADPEHPKAGKPELFLASRTIDRYAAFSPDGRWIAYSALESGKSEVYVRPYPGPGGKWQVSNSGGVRPSWSRDGRELLYIGTGGIMAAPYTANGDSFVAEQPRRWTAKEIPAIFGWALAPDGKRFLAVMPTSGAARDERPTHVTFLLNFADELRRKVPAER